MTLVKGNFLAVPLALVPAELALAAQQHPRALAIMRNWSVRRPLGRVIAAVVIAEAVGVSWSYLVIVRKRAAFDVVAQPAGLLGVSGHRRALLFAVLAASLILAELWFLVPPP